jgi:hypothetical protein
VPAGSTARCPRRRSALSRSRMPESSRGCRSRRRTRHFVPHRPSDPPIRSQTRYERQRAPQNPANVDCGNPHVSPMCPRNRDKNAQCWHRRVLRRLAVAGGGRDRPAWASLYAERGDRNVDLTGVCRSRHSQASAKPPSPVCVGTAASVACAQARHRLAGRRSFRFVRG